jgi:hypothetical protein
MPTYPSVLLHLCLLLVEVHILTLIDSYGPGWSGYNLFLYYNVLLLAYFIFQPPVKDSGYLTFKKEKPRILMRNST